MTYEELENGIYGLVVTLCRQHEAAGTDSETARSTVADWLEQVAASLRSLEKDNQHGRSEE
jgi:hypothetical protein